MNSSIISSIANKEFTAPNNQNILAGKIVKNTIKRVQNSQERYFPPHDETQRMGSIVRIGLGREEFLKRIKKQIRLQRELINLKHQLTENHKQQLANLLMEKYKLSIQIFRLHPEQLDPFFTTNQVLQTQVLARELFVQYSLTQNHWKDEIVRRFDQTVIENIFASFKNEESSSSIPISINRFAKQLNRIFEDDTILKVKDVYSIFHRLSPLNFKTILSKLVRSKTAKTLGS